MVNATLSYPDFSAGELSPRMYGRFDLAAYYSGARRMENFVCQVTGPAYFRTGTIYAAKTRDNAKAFMWTFEFTDAAAFALEFTPGYIRFFRNNGIVTETSQDITNISQASPGVLTYDGSDNFSNGDRVLIEGVSGMVELNNVEAQVANVDTANNTFELSGIDTSAYTAYVSGGTIKKIVEVTTPYTADDLFDLKFAQNNDDLYIVHPSYNPKKLTFTSATSWALTDHSPTGLTLSSNNYPSAVTFYEQRLIYAGTNNNPQTLYFSKSGDVDNFTTGTGADDGIQYTVVGGGSIEWLRGTDRFLAVGAFQDVLKVTGGIDDVITPDSISVRPTNSFGVADINPIGKGSQIFYMQKNSLIMRSLEFDFTQDSFFPADRNTIADHITGDGITQIAFEEGRPNVVWAVRTDGQLAGLTVEDTESVSGWHRHKTDGEFVSVAALPRPSEYNQVWVCVKRTINGTTSYYVEYFDDQRTYSRRNDFVGFTTTEAGDDNAFRNKILEEQKLYIHIDSTLSFDGSLTGSDAGAALTPAAVTGSGVAFTSSAAVFTVDDIGKEIWRKSTTGAEYGVARITAFNSTTKVTCEILEDFNGTSAIPAGEWFLTTNSISGLSHLEGKEVTIVADGGQHPKVTVSDGSISLNRQAGFIHIGLPYTGYIESNDIEGGGTDGASQTKKKAITGVGFRFLDTLYAKYGAGYYDLTQIEQRTASMKMNRPPTLFSGDVKKQYTNKSLSNTQAGWQREKRVIISQDQPFPCRIQLIVPYIDTSNV